MYRIKNLFDQPILFYVFVILVFAVYFAVRITSILQAVQKVRSTADTSSYVRISQEPLLASAFLSGSRPFVFPLELKLLHNNVKTVGWVQGVFSTVSWSVLALSFVHSLQTSLLRYVALCVLLLFSLCEYIIGWDTVLLTESLSLSLMALFIAAWLWLARTWQWPKVISIVLIGILWAFCRDTNAWILLMIAILLLLAVCLGALNKKYLVLSIVFGIIFALSNLSANIGGRWVYPFQNVMGRRILPDPDAVTFFAKCGMPISPRLLQMVNEYAGGQERAFFLDPALENYRVWSHQSGKACYMKWLISNPLQSFKKPLSEFNILMAIGRFQGLLFSKKFVSVLPVRLQMLLYPRQNPAALFIVALIIAVTVTWAKLWKQNNAWWVVTVLIVLVLPHYFIVWHGDVLGIDRHLIPASVQLYLGTWMVLLLSLDSILAARQAIISRIG